MTRTSNYLFVQRSLYRLSCLLAIAALLLLSACHGQRPSPELRRRVESRLYSCALDASDFPPGWRHIRSKTYDITSRGIPGNGLGGIYAVFGPHGPDPGIPAGHGILAYTTPERAQSTFGRRFPDLFYDAGRLTPWVKPDVAQADLSADAFRVGCAYYRTHDTDISRKSCHFLARYGRFLTIFETWVSPEYMSEEEMVQVLQAADEHMLQCVDAYGGAVWEEEDIE